MARNTQPVRPPPPVLNADQIRRRIQGLERCIAELEAFDPKTVQKRYNTPEVVAIETAITDALGAAFGPGTDRFNRWRALDPRRAMKLPPACGAPAGAG
jgi:hypothetical protein